MEIKLKIMVLDDEESIVNYIIKIFNLRGFECFGATSSDQALEIFEKEQPDICILDIFLVDSPLNGIEVLEEIRKKNNDTVCIMFSRVTDDENIKKANEFGAFDFLIKPLDPTRLKETVSAVAGKIQNSKGINHGE